jgi:hypothetical protein
MRVSKLYPGESDRPNGFDHPLNRQDVFIVGTGPSLRVFPIDYLRDRCCILLNRATQVLGPDFGPVAFANHRGFLDGSTCPIQIVKGRLKWQKDPDPARTDNHVPWNDTTRYVFSYRSPPWDTVSHFDRATLWAEPDYFWNVRQGSVAIFAVQFAALAGAKSISLVGCDCAEFTDGRSAGLGESKSLPYAAEAAGDPTDRVRHNYDQYAKGLDILVRECRDRFGVPLMHLSPFPGFGREQAQFRAFQEWGDNGWK